MKIFLICLILSPILTHAYYAIAYSDERRGYKLLQTPEEGTPDWLPLNISTYKMVNGTIIGKTLSYVTNYGEVMDCQVFSIDDWSCDEFGFSEGNYYDNGLPRDWKIVGRMQYYLTKCEWDVNFLSFISCPVRVLYGR